MKPYGNNWLTMQKPSNPLNWVLCRADWATPKLSLHPTVHCLPPAQTDTLLRRALLKKGAAQSVPSRSCKQNLPEGAGQAPVLGSSLRAAAALLISCATPDHPCSPCSPTRISSTAHPKFRLFAFWQCCPSVHSVTNLPVLPLSAKPHNSWLYLRWSS